MNLLFRGLAKNIQEAFALPPECPRTIPVSCICRHWEIGMACSGGNLHSITIDYSRGRL